LKIIIKIAILLIFAVAINNVAKAQLIKASLPIGFNFTQIDGDGIAGYNKVGLSAGVGALIDINALQTFEAGFEILYNQLGSKSSGAQITLQGQSLKLTYNYLSIPVFVNYKDIGKGYLGAGLVFSSLLSNKRFENKNEIVDANEVNNFDLGVFAQIGYVFNPNLRVTLRAGYSAFPFYTPRAFHNYISIRIDTILTGLFKP